MPNGQNQISGINISNYQEQKKTGNITIAKIGNSFAVSKRKWNPETGEEGDPEIISVNLQKLQEQKDILLKTIEEIDALIDDLKAL